MQERQTYINEQRTDRRAGLLLHLSSLPGPGGIGGFGKAAYRFVDMLSQAGYRTWQILPLEPTGYGDSPYQSQSLFAGNPYLIDLESLVDDGLLSREDLEKTDFGSDAALVDYGKLYTKRKPLLQEAFRCFLHREESVPPPLYNRQDLRVYQGTRHPRTEQYLLFAAIKASLNGASLRDFPEALRKRDPQALEHFAHTHEALLAYEDFVQYLFFRQRDRLFAYAKKKGIITISDTPIYIAEDGCDFWANPNLFALDEAGHPTCLSGCPPDFGSPDGQFWGSPVYDFENAKEAVFAFFDERLRFSLATAAYLRLDHFKAFESYWGIPSTAEKASEGSWKEGPGLGLFARLTSEGKALPFIAEDLGYKTEGVIQLREALKISGMRILQYGMGPYENNEHLPHNLKDNSVYYFGTHDNLPIEGWLKEASPEALAFAKTYFGLNQEEGYRNGLIRGVLASPALLACLQVQDILGLGKERQMNVPGQMGAWRFRLTPEEFDRLCSPAFVEEQSLRLRCYGRLAPKP